MLRKALVEEELEAGMVHLDDEGAPPQVRLPVLDCIHKSD